MQSTVPSKSQELKNDLDNGQKTCFGRIKLNNQIRQVNYLGCLIHYFMLSFIFVSVDSLQPMLLQQKFNIQKKEAIENFKNVFVISFDILVKILCAPVIGYLADRNGRQLINMYGILCIGITMLLMPYSPSFYIYVILRCIYASGAIAISVVPLLADYVHRQSRGTCAAILVFMSSLGAVSSATINFTILGSINIDKQKKIDLQYGVISAIIIIIGVIYTLFCLKKGNKYYKTDRQQVKKTFSQRFKQLLKVGKQTLRHSQLSTGYLAAFLARSDSILLSLYLVLWAYSFNKTDFEQASSKASALSGIAYTIIMLSCIVYGLLYSKRNEKKRNLMIIMLFFAMVGSLIMNLANSIDSFYVYPSLGLLGIGMSGLLTASLYLVNEYSTPQHRGYITGIQTFFGVVGIIFQTLIGAILYEFVNRSGPFSYFSFACFVGIIFTIYIYRRKQHVEQQKFISGHNQQNNSQLSNNLVQ